MIKTKTPSGILTDYAMKFDMSEKDNLLAFYNEVSDFVRYHPTMSEYGEDLIFGVRVSEDGTLIFLEAFNLISALAMCGIFPKNFRKVILENVYVQNNKMYTFDSKENLLVIEEIVV